MRRRLLAVLRFADVSVTISTDKKEYHPCENMTIIINLTNKREDTFKGNLVSELKVRAWDWIASFPNKYRARREDA